MNQRMIAQFLKRVSEATVEAVVIMPCWSGNNLTAALEMAVEPPLLMEASPQLLLPPPSLASSAEWTPNQWWIQKQWAVWIGVRMSSSASSRAAFRRRWRERLASSTPKTRVADGADILIEHGRSFCSRSPRCTQKALLLSRLMLS